MKSGAMKYKDGKPLYKADQNSRKVPMALLLVVLCGISFYLGGVFYSEKDNYVADDVSKEVESFEGTAGGSQQTEDTSFAECSPELQDYTPCTDPKVFPKPVSWYLDLDFVNSFG